MIPGWVIIEFLRANLCLALQASGICSAKVDFLIRGEMGEGSSD